MLTAKNSIASLMISIEQSDRSSSRRGSRQTYAAQCVIFAVLIRPAAAAYGVSVDRKRDGPGPRSDNRVSVWGPEGWRTTVPAQLSWLEPVGPNPYSFPGLSQFLGDAPSQRYASARGVLRAILRSLGVSREKNNTVEASHSNSCWSRDRAIGNPRLHSQPSHHKRREPL